MRPDERRATARDGSRLRTETVELRARQLVKRGVLDRLFPEFRAAFGKLGSAGSLAVLARWVTPLAWLAEAPPVARVRDKGGAGKLVALDGLDVRVSESGASARRPRMSKRGNRYPRRALMPAAESAAHIDPQCKAILQDQRAKGKHYRVAVSHVARKLVHVLYAVLTHERPDAVPTALLESSPPAEVLTAT